MSRITCPCCYNELIIDLTEKPKKIKKSPHPPFNKCDYCLDKKMKKGIPYLCRYCQFSLESSRGEFAELPDDWGNDRDSDTESFIYFRHHGVLIPDAIRGEYDPKRVKKEKQKEKQKKEEEKNDL